MPMTPFIHCFPELGTRETRTAILLNAEDVPDGEYGFLESYCDDLPCDCRRVVIEVVARQTGYPVAVINYGWEKLQFYERKLGSRKYAEEIVAGSLDPIHAQSSYAPRLLDVFREIVKDRSYVERLARHYQLFKGNLLRKAV
jgi:hypothetical protein